MKKKYLQVRFEWKNKCFRLDLDGKRNILRLDLNGKKKCLQVRFEWTNKCLQVRFEWKKKYLQVRFEHVQWCFLRRGKMVWAAWRGEGAFHALGPKTEKNEGISVWDCKLQADCKQQAGCKQQAEIARHVAPIGHRFQSASCPTALWSHLEIVCLEYHYYCCNIMTIIVIQQCRDV